MKKLRIIITAFFLAAMLMQIQAQPTMQDIYAVQPNVNNCTAGSLTSAEKQRLLAFINKIRKIHKLSELTYEPNGDVQAMEAALIMTANGTITHFPPASYFCYTADGATGAETSNLHIGMKSQQTLDYSEDAIVGWLIDDQSASGDQLGHRRSVINPFLNKVAFGRVDGFPKDPQTASWFTTSMSMKYQDYVGNAAQDFQLDYVAYPYENYPIDYFDKDFYLSFSAIPNKNSLWANADIDFSSAQITMQTEAGANITISNKKHDNDGWGSLPNNLQWKAAGLQNGVKYLVSITNVKYNGTTKNYSYWFKLTDEELPEELAAPSLTFPQNNSTDLDNNIDFSWSAVTNAINYNLQVSESNNFSNLVVNENVNPNSFTKVLVKGNTYFWRVKAMKNELESEFSEVFTFTTEAVQPINAPELISPVDNKTNFPVIGKIIWNAADGMNIKYHLQVSINNSFTDTPVIDKNNISTVFYDLLEGDLADNTKYYWRVKAYNDDTESQWSAVRNFSTEDPSSVIDNISSNHLLVYPNPANDIINIQLLESGQAEYMIYSLDGALIASKRLETSEGLLSISTSNLNSGKYFVKIIINGKSFETAFEIFR